MTGKISKEATITFRSLEGLTTLVAQQREGISKLQSIYASWFKSVEPLIEEAADNLDPCLIVPSEDRKYSIQLSDATAVLEDFVTLVIDSMQLIDQEDTEHIVKNVSTCSANLLSDIAAVVAERDSSKMRLNLSLLFCRTS
ncbi:hypothetical protein PsorP6_005225 [Peronosclerospora sorghi]|uniref:Uncharacterized protein n=1 Tax=Peronosclerospora sorghi TaxID=230839 RepID=A0ACC0W5P5_9STRA|nr:hypothetical protein PsorP6_005225 [Peronosclerospora sorghi]